MRSIKMGLITLTATAALVIPAAGATASTEHNTSAVTTSSSGCVILCFDHLIDNVVTDNNVEISPTVSFCGIQAAQLQALSIGQSIVCVDGGGHKSVKRTK
jgi:hypothetical protein